MLEVQKRKKKTCILLSAKRRNYCSDAKRDLTPRIPLNCRTVCQHRHTFAAQDVERTGGCSGEEE